jgi:hypothetical protein
MSIIHDALRRGRGQHSPKARSSAAQSDAVLETLAYGRANATAPSHATRRVIGGVAVTIFLIILSGVIVWMMRV